MSTEKQIRANRKNARKSTGPTSTAGKTSSRRNSVKHGLTARRQILLSDEDGRAYEDLRRSLHEQLQPLGSLEEELCNRIVDLAWRLRRVGGIESGLLELAFRDSQLLHAQHRLRTSSDLTYRPGEYDSKENLAAKADYAKKQKARDSASGLAFAADADTWNAMSKLSRYETTLWNHFKEARKELETLQNQRVEPAEIVESTSLNPPPEEDAPRAAIS